MTSYRITSHTKHTLLYQYGYLSITLHGTDHIQ